MLDLKKIYQKTAIIKYNKINIIWKYLFIIIWIVLNHFFLLIIIWFQVIMHVDDALTHNFRMLHCYFTVFTDDFWQILKTFWTLSISLSHFIFAIWIILLGNFVWNFHRFKIHLISLIQSLNKLSIKCCRESIFKHFSIFLFVDNNSFVSCQLHLRKKCVCNIDEI